MKNHRIVILILSILATLILCSACTDNSDQKSPVITPTLVNKAVDLQNKAFNAYINGNFTAALDLYEQAIAADSKYTRAWMEKGNVLIRLNRTEEAISAYDSALAVDNNLPIVWNYKGEALLALGRYSEALESFEQALEIAPEYAKAKENRNLTLSKLK